jgi:hypothetical protein
MVFRGQDAVSSSVRLATASSFLLASPGRETATKLMPFAGANSCIQIPPEVRSLRRVEHGYRLQVEEGQINFGRDRVHCDPIGEIYGEAGGHGESVGIEN